MLRIEGRNVDVVQHGAGQDLLILHSLLGDHSSFDAMVPRLAPRYRMTLPNLPGYGTTERLEEPITVERYADWVAELIRALELPASTVVLGNGLGGFVSVALAARHGGRFGRLIVADAAASFPPAAKEPLRGLSARVAAVGMEGALDAAVRRMFPEPYIASNPKVIEERRAALARADALAFQRACLALAAVDLYPVLGSIRKPVLVAVGAEDLTTPPALGRALADGIAGSRYEEITGCGHCPQIQDPEALERLIDGFISG
jgi:3-oxoadipate enol-lactonase